MSLLHIVLYSIQTKHFTIRFFGSRFILAVKQFLFLHKHLSDALLTCKKKHTRKHSWPTSRVGDESHETRYTGTYHYTCSLVTLAVSHN